MIICPTLFSLNEARPPAPAPGKRNAPLGPSGPFGVLAVGFAVNRLRGPRHNPPRSRQFYYEKMFSVFVPKTKFEFDWKHCPILAAPAQHLSLAGQTGEPRRRYSPSAPEWPGPWQTPSVCHFETGKGVSLPNRR